MPAIPQAWPFQEAAKVVDRLRAKPGAAALFETGYGPSGLPHIGTFGEVARTSWVRRAYEALTGAPTRLIAFSDDLDGLRKVPANLPNQAMLTEFIGQPLTRVPDPFGTHESFGAHNNARLRAFLDRFGFAYEFQSAADFYHAGRMDGVLRTILERWDAVIAVILPTLGPERRATYAPILPIHPRTGVVMQVPVESLDAAAGTIVWTDPADGARHETSVLGGAAKLQWKADWAGRWVALGVDYEMSGKDLIDSVKLSSRICAVLGAAPPAGMTYELFLDEAGQKISKSKGNGLSVDDWLRYAPADSLAQFMYHAPARAKRLYFDVIPRMADEFSANAARLARADAPVVEPPSPQPSPARGEGASFPPPLEGGVGGGVGSGTAYPAAYSNPAWFILHGRAPESVATPISFQMLLNLASVINASEPHILWGFIARYLPGVSAATSPALDALVGHAVRYYQDFVRPMKRYRPATPQEAAALRDLADAMGAIPPGASAEAIQDVVYEAGKRHFADLKAWFGCLYQVLLGQAEGPRFGGFAALYGVPETVALIGDALAGGLVTPMADGPGQPAAA